MSIEEAAVANSERVWATAMAAVMIVLLVAIVYAAVGMHLNPPSNIETIDPTTLHVVGEFTEDNLGTQVSPKGEVVTRIVAAQFAFQPACVVVPQDTPITLRLASPDVIHGVMVVGTNVNTMVVPGYVSQVRTAFRKTGEFLMPCHEFCGLGHSQMLAHIRVVPKADFKPDLNGRATCAAQ
jgi:cytochrome c oxidase subunit 2